MFTFALSPFNGMVRTSLRRSHILANAPQEFRIDPVYTEVDGRIVENKKTFFQRAKEIYTYRKLKKNTGFDKETFPFIAQDMYLKLQNAIMRKDMKAIEDLCTYQLYLSVKSEFLETEKQITWHLVRENSEPRILSAAGNSLSSGSQFFQVLVQMDLVVFFNVRDSNGRFLAGDDHEAIRSKEHVVFEISDQNPDMMKWRVAFRYHPAMFTTKSPSEALA